MNALQGDNPMLSFSWSPLSAEDGVDFLVNYNIRITIITLPQLHTKRPEPEESSIEIVVDKNQASFEYTVEPYTMYIAQVFTQLNVNGGMIIRAITSPINVSSPESGNIYGIYITMRLETNWEHFL